MDIGHRWLFEGKNKKPKFIVEITSISSKEFYCKIDGKIIQHFIDKEFERESQTFSLKYLYEDHNPQKLPGGGRWLFLKNQDIPNENS